MAKRLKGDRIIFRDKQGKFVPSEDRYTGKVNSVQVRRRGYWITVLHNTPITVEKLAMTMTRDEFEMLPEALAKTREYKSSKKYKAWDIAEQIDKSKGLRRKLLKIELELLDGKSRKKTSFYHVITSNKSRSYQIFVRINEAIGLEGGYLYNRVGTKLLDRKGKKVKLDRVTVSEVL